MLKKTPLYDKHLALGGKMVEFAGYELPVQYSGLIAEHNAVRRGVGLFDVSHMGELLVTGKNAEAALNYLMTNDIRGMADGQARYSLMANERGGAVDDVIVYRENAEKFWIVVNGANAEKDAEWVRCGLAGGAEFEDCSAAIAQIAVQGPLAEAVIMKLTAEKDVPRKRYRFTPDAVLAGERCCLSRTGYTGEDGFEIYCAADSAAGIYDALLEAGGEFGVLPCGLGARDTLRLEAGMPLYGHELGEDIPVNETGLDFAIKMQKPDFAGKAALEAHAPGYARVGARVADRGIVREGCEIFCGDVRVGVATSGTHSPTLGSAICMLRVKKEFIGRELTAEVRGRRLRLKPSPLQFLAKS